MIYKSTLYLLLTLLFSVGQTQLPLQKVDRILSIDITMAQDNDYNSAFALAKDAGIQATSLSLSWADFETSANTFEPETNWLKIANDYYPAQNTQISLMLGFIDTNNLRLPHDLQNRDFDDPELINRFKAFVDYVFLQIPNLELNSLAINNEIDIYLGTDKLLWQQYQVFYQEIANYIHTTYPDIKLGSKITFDGLSSFAKLQAKELNLYSDVIMLTYYPLNANFSVKEPSTVSKDFALFVELYPDKPIYILEAGYPSSSLLGSSEEKQAEFIKEVFIAWDANVEHIKLIDFTWLHDISPSSLIEYSNYYGINSSFFLAYLETLGLRTFDGEDKKAFKIFINEVKARAW